MAVQVIMRALNCAIPIVILISGLIGAAIPSQAQTYNGMTLADYERLTANEASVNAKKIAHWYIEGIATATADLNGMYQALSSRRFFCPPREFVFGPAELQDLLTEELAKNGGMWRQTPMVPIEQVAVQALARRYPCR